MEKYDASNFERPSVTVDMLIFTVTDEEKENYRELSEKFLNPLYKCISLQGTAVRYIDYNML